MTRIKDYPPRIVLYYRSLSVTEKDTRLSRELRSCQDNLEKVLKTLSMPFSNDHPLFSFFWGDPLVVSSSFPKLKIEELFIKVYGPFCGE